MGIVFVAYFTLVVSRLLSLDSQIVQLQDVTSGVQRTYWDEAPSIVWLMMWWVISID